MSIFFPQIHANLGYSALQLILLGTFSVPMAEAEEFPSTTFGDGGGTTSYNLDCGSNGTMVGVMHKAHVARIDRLAVICRTIKVQTGALGDEYTRGPVGGFDGRDFSERCQEGTVATRINSVVHDQFVRGFILGCDPWNASNRQIEQGVEPDNVHKIGIPFRVNPFDLPKISGDIGGSQCAGIIGEITPGQHRIETGKNFSRIRGQGNQSG